VGTYHHERKRGTGCHPTRREGLCHEFKAVPDWDHILGRGCRLLQGPGYCKTEKQSGAIDPDCILAVYTTYTLSSSWAASYAAFGGASLFEGFNIQGRVAKAGAKDAWVTSSLMNSTAVHLLGYLIVASAPSGSLLARVRAERGTPFAVVTTSGEAHEIMKAAAANVTADERALLAEFSTAASKTIALVSALFGVAGADVSIALAAANKFVNTIV